MNDDSVSLEERFIPLEVTLQLRVRGESDESAVHFFRSYVSYYPDSFEVETRTCGERIC